MQRLAVPVWSAAFDHSNELSFELSLQLSHQWTIAGKPPECRDNEHITDLRASLSFLRYHLVRMQRLVAFH